MIIKLDIFECCNNCPHFEARVNKTNADGSFGKDVGTVISCSNADKCELIAKYLLKRIKSSR